MYGKKEDRWLFASPSPDGFAFQAATQATTRLPPLVVLITRGMTTQPHAKRTSRIVSFLIVIGISPNGAAILGTGCRSIDCAPYSPIGRTERTSSDGSHDEACAAA